MPWAPHSIPDASADDAFVAVRSAARGFDQHLERSVSWSGTTARASAATNLHLQPSATPAPDLNLRRRQHPGNGRVRLGPGSSVSRETSVARRRSRHDSPRRSTVASTFDVRRSMFDVRWGASSMREGTFEDSEPVSQHVGPRDVALARTPLMSATLGTSSTTRSGAGPRRRESRRPRSRGCRFGVLPARVDKPPNPARVTTVFTRPWTSSRPDAGETPFSPQSYETTTVPHPEPQPGPMQGPA
jgi:hypothetical protein